MSAAGEERIAAAQRARWAKQKGTVTAAKSGTAAGKKAGLKQAGKTKVAPAEKRVTKTLPRAVAPRIVRLPRR